MLEKSSGAEPPRTFDSDATLVEHLLVAGLMAGPFFMGGTATWSYPALSLILALPLARSFCMPDAAPARAVVVALTCMAAIAVAQLCFPRPYWGPAQIVGTVDPHATAEALQLVLFSAVVFCAAYTVSASRLCWYLFTSGVLLSLIGLLQRWAGNTHYYGLIPIRVGDPFGPYTNANQAAVHLELALFAGAGAIASWWRGGAGRRVRVSPDAAAQLVLLVGGLMLIAAALYSTRSRAALLASGATFAIAIPALTMKSKWRVKIVSGTLLASLFAAGYNLMGTVMARDISINFRLTVYSLCLELIQDFPLFGSGAGAFMKAFDPFVPASITWGAVDHVHSDWLQLAAEFGVPLALLVAAASTWAISYVWMSVAVRDQERFIRWGLWAGCLSTLLHAAVDFPFRNPAVALLTLAALGAACGAVQWPRTRSRRAPAYAIAVAIVSLSLFPMLDVFSSHRLVGGLARVYDAR